MPVDVPNFLHQERIECSVQAARQYRIPALVLLAVAEQEGGKAGQRVRNRNGTFRLWGDANQHRLTGRITAFRHPGKTCFGPGLLSLLSGGMADSGSPPK